MSDGVTERGPAADHKIRVLLVDDHPSIRRMLVLALEEEPDIDIVGQAAEGKEGVRLTRELRPDLVVMDVSMPVMDGVAATRLIHAEFPDIRVLGLTVFDEEDAGDAMRQAGAVGFLSKDKALGTLAEAIRRFVLRSPSSTP